MLRKTTGAAARGYHKRRDAILSQAMSAGIFQLRSIREKHRPANTGAELASSLTVRVNGLSWPRWRNPTADLRVRASKPRVSFFLKQQRSFLSYQRLNRSYEPCQQPRQKDFQPHIILGYID